METYLTQITNYLLTQSWQIAILVVVVAAATYALRNRSAHVRYLLWLIVLAKCLTPPLLEVPLAVLPERTPVAAALTAPMPAAAEAMQEAPRPTKPAPIVAPVPHSQPRLSPRQWVAIGWLAGMLAFACIAAAKAGRTVRWLHGDRRPLPDEVQNGVNDLLSSLNLGRLPKMWLLEGIGQPFVWGALRGGIYLPASFVRIPDDERRKHILAHELSHVVRFDAAVNLLQTIAQAALWFHPFVWWANKKIRAEREKCCDEMAIARLNTQAKDYSRAIVETLVTEYESSRPVPSLAIAGPVKNIEERIRTMLKPGKKFYKHPSLPAAVVVVLTALLAVPTTVVLTARADTTPIFGDPVSLGPTVNSSAYEWDPDISDDGTSLHFMSRRSGGLGNADIWVTTRKSKDESWGPPVNLGPAVNTPEFEGAPCLSHDGLSLYFVSSRPGSNGWTDIWVATRKGKGDPWDKPGNLGSIVNGPMWENNPSVSADGLALYFSEFMNIKSPRRAGGFGGADIWVATRESKDDSWRAPVNLGLTVSSSYHESSPSISRDELSLYLQSDRLGGFGGGDIWVTTRRSKDQPWGTPVNLGPPVNSAHYEYNPDISSDGSTLYFVSERSGAVGGSDDVDIWQASLKTNRAKDEAARKEESTKSIHQAVADCDIEQVKSLIAEGIDVNARDKGGKTPLQNSVRYGHRDVAELLISEGADVNVEFNALGEGGMSLLHLAAWHGNKDVTDLLIAKGLNVNVKNENGATPLLTSAWRGHKEVAKTLIASGAHLNSKAKDGKTPTYLAVVGLSSGKKEMIELLVEAGASLPAIHLAALRGNLEEVRVSLRQGEEIDVRDDCESTPLHAAVNCDQTDAVEFLLSEGADINAQDLVGGTPLYHAVMHGYKEMAILLVDRGADVNLADKSDWTPLHWATGWADSDTAQTLIAKGANINAKTDKGETPLFMAKKNGSNGIIELLRKHGAKE